MALMAGCGGDDGGSSNGVNEEDDVDRIEACAQAAGFDPTIDEDVESGGIAIDLTTNDATIVVHVFDSEGDAEAYSEEAPLDAEVVGSAVILGGAIPTSDRDTIAGCIEGA
jgi:hypothetical protein